MPAVPARVEKVFQCRRLSRTTRLCVKILLILITHNTGPAFNEQGLLFLPLSFITFCLPHGYTWVTFASYWRNLYIVIITHV